MSEPQTELAIKPHRESVATLMVVVCLALAGTWYLVGLTQETLLSGGLLLASVGVLFIVFSGLMYLLFRVGLFNLAGNIVQFGRRGISAQTLLFGKVHLDREHIRSLRITTNFAIPILIVEIHETNESRSRYFSDGGIVARLWGSLFGFNLIWPMSWLELTEEELLSFVGQYSEFLRQKRKSKNSRPRGHEGDVPSSYVHDAVSEREVAPAPAPRAAAHLEATPIDAKTPSPSAYEAKPKTDRRPEKKVEEKERENRPKENEKSEPKQETKPDLYQETKATVALEQPDDMSPEKQAVLAKVLAIKQLVRESHIDRKTTEYFHEFFQHYPNWLSHGDDRCPIELTHAEARSDSHKETVILQYSGHRLEFVYERLGKGDSEEELRLVFDGEEKLCLGVEMEIGTLAPVEVKGFHRGEWLKTYMKLLAHVDKLLGKQAGIHRETKNINADSSEERTLEELKKRFKL